MSLTFTWGTLPPTADLQIEREDSVTVVKEPGLDFPPCISGTTRLSLSFKENEVPRPIRKKEGEG